MPIEWIDDNNALLNGIKLRYVSSGYSEARTSDAEIIVLKPRQFFEDYQALLPDNQRSLNIVELGIFEGGSALILAAMYPNAKIIGFDLRRKNDAVLGHIDRMGYGERVKLCYETSQDNAEAITREIKSNFMTGIDLVIDDASHNYALTRKAFEIVFPLLRSGGLYVIEDWGWAHWPGTNFDDWKGITLSSFVLELVMASATSPQLISQITASSRFALVRKGPGPTSDPFVFDHVYKIAPRQWSPVRLLPAT
jgi:cephalosporin hydroxylase